MVDAARRLLVVGNKTHSIPEKPFEILELLLQGDGRLVEREAFFGRVWGDESPSDATLTQHVFTLRRLLREIAGDLPYIVTVPGKGYRFAHPVERKIGLAMKSSCERCAGRLGGMDEALICSYECTYCPDCARAVDGVCSNCGGRLERRPPRA